MKRTYYDLIVAGGNAAGMSAASQARRIDKNLTIAVFDSGDFVSYANCGIPYYLSNVIKDLKDLILYTPQHFKNTNNIDVFIKHRIDSIHAAKRELLIHDISCSKTIPFTYKHLIIATGATPIFPFQFKLPIQGVFSFRNLSHAIAARNYMSQQTIKNVVIMGGGLLGLELAETFHRLTCNITVIEKESRILNGFDPEFSEIAVKELLARGVAVLEGEFVKAVNHRFNKIVSVETSTGRILPADILIIAIGIKPNTEMWREGGIKLNSDGSIRTDARMETEVKGVFAAGDCCATYHQVLKCLIYRPLGTAAIRQGYVAGENAAGSNAAFKGSLCTATLKLFDLEFAMTGAIPSLVKNNSIPIVSSDFVGWDHASYYPNALRIKVKLSANLKTGKLTGGQIAGYEKAAKRIDVIATAIAAGMSPADLASCDYAYAPSIGSLNDPLKSAAYKLAKSFK